MVSRDYFKDKRIAVIGLGPYGELIADIKYLIKSGSYVSVYDLRSEARIRNHTTYLKSIGLANCVCGSIPADDLLDMDMIILSHDYPRESSFLSEAKKKGIDIEYPETLFFKLSVPLIVIGVIGTCGKSTVLSMIRPILEKVCGDKGGQSFFVIDPDSAEGILSNLKNTNTGDIALVRITEEMAREYCNIRISPHVAVFTSVLPAMYYHESPFEILNFQTYNNFIVAPDHVIDATYNHKFQAKAKMLRTKPSLIPSDWDFSGNGDHDRDNAALAIQVAKLFKADDDIIRHCIEEWKSLKGRLELIKKVRNVEYYNDTASVSNYSTEAGLRTISKGKDIVLIFGGVDRGYDYRTLYSILPNYVHTIVLLPGSGTLKERLALSRVENVLLLSAPSIEEATRLACDNAKKGDKVLFSPGFGAGGIDSTRKDRGERFARTVRIL